MRKAYLMALLDLEEGKVVEVGVFSEANPTLNLKLCQIVLCVEEGRDYDTAKKNALQLLSPDGPFHAWSKWASSLPFVEEKPFLRYGIRPLDEALGGIPPGTSVYVYGPRRKAFLSQIRYSNLKVPLRWCSQLIEYRWASYMDVSALLQSCEGVVLSGASMSEEDMDWVTGQTQLAKEVKRSLIVSSGHAPIILGCSFCKAFDVILRVGGMGENQTAPHIEVKKSRGHSLFDIKAQTDPAFRWPDGQWRIE